MQEDMSNETLLRYFEDIFRTDKYRLKITETGTAYPDEKSVEVEFDDIDNYNRELGDYLLNHPLHALQVAEEAVKQVLPPDIQNPLHVRVSGLPGTSNIQVRDLRGAHLGKFISIYGLVRKVTEVRPRLIEATFRCARCGHDNVIPQDDIYVKEPLVCEGCGKGANQTSFYLLQDFSRYVDTQRIEIQENPEGLAGGEQPQRLAAYLEDDLTGVLNPGDRVILNGTLMSRQKHSGRMKSTVFDIYLAVNSLELRHREYEEIDISEEDVVKIEELANDPHIFDKLVHSIAPTIFGMDTEKEALVLQLFGGVRKFMPDGTKIRGDIHVLLVGDPGTAKSQILRYISQISPRGIYTSGQATTKAGLTATAVRDDSGDGRWTLEAGALVLADKGIACLLPDTEVVVDNTIVEIDSIFDAGNAEKAMSNGEEVEVAPIRKEVLSLKTDKSLETCPAQATKVRRKHYSGEVVDIKFESGFRLSVTADHRLIDGETLQWKEAGDFQRREFVVAPFNFSPPPDENDTLTLLRVLGEFDNYGDYRFFVDIGSENIKKLEETLAAKKRGISSADRERFLRHLNSSTGKKGMLPPSVLLALIEMLRIKRKWQKKEIEIYCTLGNERQKMSSLPPSLFYLFGRVFADHRRVMKETRPVRLLFQKFKRNFAEEYNDISMSAFREVVSPHIRLMEALYHHVTRDSLAHLCTFPDSCVRGFIAGVIDSNVNVSIDTKERKGKKHNIVVLRIVLPTMEKESLHLLYTLRRYNVYGRLIRRRHMYTIMISNDSDVNNLRALLGNYSINIAMLPPSEPHYYDISTTYTTSNILPKERIREVVSEMLKERKWGRSVQGILETFSRGEKWPVREHFNLVMSHLDRKELGDYYEKLNYYLSRGYLLDRIVSIKKREYSGPVYDLYVPGPHNFVAGGVFVHNCIDELDKMSREDSSGMHEALEQQQISIAKAGINAVLQTRCSLLAAANPKFGRFDQEEHIFPQINMLPSLISRFDLIFPVFDRPNPKKDAAVASHILKVHEAGELIERKRMMNLAENDEEIDKKIAPVLSVDFIRKYIAYAKKFSFPVLEKEASDFLNRYYVQFRQTNTDKSAVPITARQLEAMVRLSEASARVRLSHKVTREDAERAVRIVKYSLQMVAADSEGNFDIDIMTGIPHERRSRLITLRKILETLSRQSEDGSFTEEAVIEMARSRQIGSGEVKKFLKSMMDEGELYEPQTGKFRFT